MGPVLVGIIGERILHANPNPIRRAVYIFFIKTMYMCYHTQAVVFILIRPQRVCVIVIFLHESVLLSRT